MSSIKETDEMIYKNKKFEGLRGILNYKVPIYPSTHIPIYFFSVYFTSSLQRKEFDWRVL